MPLTRQIQRVRSSNRALATAVVLVLGLLYPPHATADASSPTQLGVSDCTTLPRVTPGDHCGSAIERGGAVCEWTGACGAVDGSPCSNQCIASLVPLAEIANIRGGFLQAPGITYCHLLGSVINRAYTIIQDSSDGEAEPPAVVFAANDATSVIPTTNSTDDNTTAREPLPDSIVGDLGGGVFTGAPASPAGPPAEARRRLQQTGPASNPAVATPASASGEGCPTDAVIEAVVASPQWPTLLRTPRDITDRSNLRDRPTLFGSLTTDTALKAFFNGACKSEEVQPPLSALFPPAEEAPQGQCPADRPLAPLTVCRDSLGLLEAAYGDFTDAATLSEFLQAASQDLQSACEAARAASPTAACSPAVWLMDDKCSQRMLDLMGAPLPDSVITSTALKAVNAAYVALHGACGKLKTKEECFKEPFPELRTAVARAAAAVLPDLRNPPNPSPAGAETVAQQGGTIEPGADSGPDVLAPATVVNPEQQSEGGASSRAAQGPQTIVAIAAAAAAVMSICM